MPWVVPLLFAAVFLLGYLGRRQAMPAPAPIWVDPGALSFTTLPEWCDPRWADALEQTVAYHPPFLAGDRAALDALAEDLGTLSFVRGLPRLEIDADSGLAIDLRLQRPVAAVPVREGFLLVARDGTLLAGRWSTPPRFEGAFLPVVGPMNDAFEFFGVAQPGDWLAEPRHLDAIDVAVSMADHLSVPERIRMGRVVIDATRAAATSPDEPGIRLDLVDGVRVLFGRAPTDPAPGELPAGRKWRSVARFLDLVERGDLRRLVDVRWDRPDVAPAEAPRLAQAGERASSPRPSVASAPGRSRPIREPDRGARVR